MGVLSIGKLGAGKRTERYYTQAVAQGREDYYAGRGEAPGVWVGSGWGEEEHDHPVSEADLRALLQGIHPRTEQPLRHVVAGATSGFDLTFSAPKSVSILYALGDRQISAAVRDAHEAAIRDSLGYLERNAAFSRRGRGGRDQIQTDGFLAAAFRHRTSRAGDPQLHTHVVVANGARGTDGRWGTLDGRHLYRHLKTAGYLYQASLRRQLTNELGVQWTAVSKGAAEVVGVPRSLISHFSQRRVEITRHLAARGQRSPAAAWIAALDTRRAKIYDVPVETLRDQWRIRAEQHGFTHTDLQAVLHREREIDPTVLDQGRAAARIASSAGITRDVSTFSRRDVLQAWAHEHRDGATVAELEHAAQQWLRRPDVVELEHRPGDNEPIFSTKELMDTEQSLINSAQRRRAEGVATVPAAAVTDAVRGRPTIAGEQADLVLQLATSGDGIQVVRSAAGTGKTFALDAAREAWETEGIRVIGTALSARAAAELRDGAGIESTTIARLHGDLDRGYGLPTGGVLVVDEAGMVGTRDLALLAQHAEHAQTKLVLVGDDRQLPEIQAGGSFTAIADHIGALELREVRRQHEAWDREALLELRDGDVEQWADAYIERGRITRSPNAERTRQQLVASWHHDTVEHPDQETVMIALRRSDVADLNDRARNLLRTTGQLESQEIDAAGHPVAVGERVSMTRNDRAMEIVNGERGTITAIDAERATATVRVGDRDVELGASYLEQGGITYGYATTVHKLQGATVDRTHLLGSDELYREAGYTALSRHREQATFHVTTPQRQDPLPGIDPEATLDAVHVRQLERTRAEPNATERGPAMPAEIDPIALYESVPPEARALTRDLQAREAARAAHAAAVERAGQARRDLEQTSRLRRAVRDAAQARLAGHEAAIAHWQRETIEMSNRVDASSAIADDWLETHRNKVDRVLGAQARLGSLREAIDAVAQLAAEARRRADDPAGYLGLKVAGRIARDLHDNEIER